MIANSVLNRVLYEMELSEKIPEMVKIFTSVLLFPAWKNSEHGKAPAKDHPAGAAFYPFNTVTVLIPAARRPFSSKDVGLSALSLAGLMRYFLATDQSVSVFAG